MFFLNALILGVFALLGSFALYFIAAVFAQISKNRVIWVCTSYCIFVLLTISIILHYIDGPYFIASIKTLFSTIVYTLTTLIVPILLHKKLIRLWNIWVYSFILPLFIFSATINLSAESKLPTKGQLEEVLDLTLPRYKVLDYKDFTPGGDDWETHFKIQFKEGEELNKLYKIMEDRCTNSTSTYSHQDCYTIWYSGNSYYCFHNHYDLEHWLTINVNTKTNTLEYHYKKI